MTQRLDPDHDLDSLVRQLNATARSEGGPGTREPPVAEPLPAIELPAVGRPAVRWELPEPTGEGHDWLDRLVESARRLDASDLLLVPGRAPAARVHGRLMPCGEAVLTSSSAALLCSCLLPPERRQDAQRRGSEDFALRRAPHGRLRCNVHRQRGEWAAAVRLLPAEPPQLERLGLPASMQRFADLEYGLVLVTGPTGSGKSTTLAALIRRILERRRVHLITIEDPVEYEHPHGDSVVEHIEIGRDAADFPQALRSVLRQDPDVLLIGEMRDAESMSIAITAAETGHLVLSTLHTGEAPQTLHRILDSYPSVQRESVRAQIAASLAGVVSQQLVPRRDGQGRVPAVEILVATPAVRNLIRQGKIEQLRAQLTLERPAGMLDFDRSLAVLVRDGSVDAAEARVRARTPSEFESLLRSVMRP